MKTETNSDGLRALLTFLAASTEQAGEQYEALRRALIRFFEVRQVMAMEELADMALDRVGKKILEGESIKDIAGYCFGVARYVYLEWARNPRRNQVPIDDLMLQMIDKPFTELESSRLDCMKHCFQSLSPEKRLLVKEYFDGEGRKRTRRREELAVRLGVNQAALYNRIKRLLERLRDCKTECLRQAMAR